MKSLCKAGCVALVVTLSSGHAAVNSHVSSLVLGSSSLRQEVVNQLDDTLPGRDVPFEQAARGCRGAIVAQLLNLGSPDAGPPGAWVYSSSKWKVTKVFRGKYKDETSFSLTVQMLPKYVAEEAPKPGSTYILITYPQNATQVRKMLAASAGNLKQVEALVRKRRQSNKGMKLTANQQAF